MDDTNMLMRKGKCKDSRHFCKGFLKMVCPPLTTLQITHTYMWTSKSRISGYFGRRKDLWKKIIERVGSYNSVWESQYVGNHQLHLDLASTWTPWFWDSRRLLSLIWSSGFCRIILGMQNLKKGQVNWIFKMDFQHCLAPFLLALQRQ